ncbi:MAG: hypothetical protein C3F06_13180 [Candidatus Methanoperedenaceae archaeon]|nr:MAG: hypothetical protein C3F06_13180 [Candidatus Methanoperedenaceae archaeon]
MSESVRESTKKPEAAKSQTRTSYYSLPAKSTVDHILFFQRTIGNQAVVRLMKSGTIQAKLRVGQPGDIYEQEADKVAEQVMRMSDISEAKDTRMQEKCPKCLKGLNRFMGKDEKNEKLQAKETRNQTPEVKPLIEENIISSKSGGQPLPESVRSFFEPRFGYDFSNVKIHNDVKAAESARVLQAHAFTFGEDLFFGEGQYEPETIHGKTVLAHELTHIVQQKESNLQKKPSVSQSDVEANVLPSTISRSPFVVQRIPSGTAMQCDLDDIEHVDVRRNRGGFASFIWTGKCGSGGPLWGCVNGPQPMENYPSWDPEGGGDYSRSAISERNERGTKNHPDIANCFIDFELWVKWVTITEHDYTGDDYTLVVAVEYMKNRRGGACNPLRETGMEVGCQTVNSSGGVDFGTAMGVVGTIASIAGLIATLALAEAETGEGAKEGSSIA